MRGPRPSVTRSGVRATVAFAAVLATAGCAPRAAPAAAGTAVVVRPIDGDTVDVRVAGHTERVRLLGIDTPETKAPGRPIECFGPEAARALASLLPRGTPVTLERDAEARDDYGRLLAYVTRRGESVSINEQLAGAGFAEALVIEPNVAYRDRIRQAVGVARRQGLGLWHACG